MSDAEVLLEATIEQIDDAESEFRNRDRFGALFDDEPGSAVGEQLKQPTTFRNIFKPNR